MHEAMMCQQHGAAGTLCIRPAHLVAMRPALKAQLPHAGDQMVVSHLCSHLSLTSNLHPACEYSGMPHVAALACAQHMKHHE